MLLKTEEADSCRSTSSACIYRMGEAGRLVAEVDADVEASVIPIGVMAAAPIAILIYSVHVVIDLAAVIAVTRGVTIDSGAIVLEPLLTST